MPSNLETQIQQLLTQQKYLFCQKQVSETNLAGFQHQKDHIFLLKKPICQDCWTKNNDLNNQFFSSLEQIKNTNQKLQSWIKSCKEKQKPTKNNPQKEEREKIYEDWREKLNHSKYNKISK